ncbi:metallophosphoesterase [Chitinophaga sp. sic0106]|uniref:metallophosphoesterase n=1 Tax=Chitinophaga sp. sic0106 TaxID=2854785 RepID=UPI001C45611B|nr:metallophosphoesterase [Chitinophaga sp. sic0106]MBV7531022.1 metallophosphoesterase [Chitinophaga sp. sic0106]
MNTRRSFLRNTSLAAGLLLFKSPVRAFASSSTATIHLEGDSTQFRVHYTNDMHGAIFKDNGLPGDLLVDAGDFTDGSNDPASHFRLIEAMNKAGYHAATIGNRELANGPAALAALIPAMNFALVNCNYRFADAQLGSLVKQEVIVRKGLLKIGITGVGPALPGISGVTVTDPVAAANAAAKRLREQGCQVVICLSHLGFDPTPGKVSNYLLANDSNGINFIAGGHHHGYNSSLRILRNKEKSEVMLGHTSGNAQLKGTLAFDFNEQHQLMNIKAGKRQA